jgi:hypothetical protein
MFSFRSWKSQQIHILLTVLVKYKTWNLGFQSLRNARWNRNTLAKKACHIVPLVHTVHNINKKQISVLQWRSTGIFIVFFVNTTLFAVDEVVRWLCWHIYHLLGPVYNTHWFNSWRYQIFLVVVGLERGPFSLMSSIDDLLGRKSSGSSQENRDYSRRDLPCWPCNTPLSAKVGPTSGGRLVGIFPCGLGPWSYLVSY